MRFSKAVQRAFRMCGLSLTRLPANRFDAMPDVLQRLAQEGFAPTLVIDVGANQGQWATTLSRAFPRVPLHMIEPQASCRAVLEALVARRGNAEVHSVAVTRPGIDDVRMAGAGSSGAHVIHDTIGRTDGESVPATTIDALFAARLRDTDRVLLKLDIEGHELEALAGARAVLRQVAVIVSEVTFYEIEHSANPTFLTYATALADEGFVLYDFAALGSARRNGRLRLGDAVFVRRGSTLVTDDRWA